MFTRSCGENAPHSAHEYVQLWRKAELPFLLHPDEYPDSWESPYSCQGVTTTPWNVVYMHTNCPECEGCADEAIEQTLDDSSSGSTWTMMVPATYPAGTFAIVGHQASVTRA